MKHRLLTAGILAALTTTAMSAAQIFAYSTADGTSGLRIASRASETGEWTPIGEGFDFVRSDFGPWGSGKKMYDARLAPEPDGSWSLTWALRPDGQAYALTTSADLLHWAPQTYSYSRHSQPETAMETAVIGGVSVTGRIIDVDDSTVASLTAHVGQRAGLAAIFAETTADDQERFKGLTPLTLDIKVRPGEAKEISDKLIGIFFEDINYGADGGLYAELVQNRDFEYSTADRHEWNSLTAWDVNGSSEIRDDNPIHANNPHYLRMMPGASATNSGYDGIVLRKDDRYTFSVKARAEKPAELTVTLTDGAGTVLATRRVEISGRKWSDYRLTLIPSASATDGRLTVTAGAETDVDMISLFPEATFKCRTNGLRADLAQTLADLHPKFVRFPGGCVAHGNGLDNSYDWKGSVGPLEARRPLSNLWGYHQTRGLGYYEYFLFCEDIGAEPLPVVAAGVPCQNSQTPWRGSCGLLTTEGQQSGVPMNMMDSYIRDILDLIEYANGPADSEWGRLRAEAGHPEPFNLKYIGIGNEDMITPVFEERFRMINAAVTATHPEVEVIGTVGPFYEGSDYDAGWALARELNLPMVDEHYYVQPGWMIYNRDFYDNYPRGATRVYLGEYAAHRPDRANTVETALAEALYLTDVERNADVVAMTSYAPLLAKRGHTQWAPDLIFFDNLSVTPTVDYYVQQLFGQNSGNRYLPSASTLSSDDPKARARVGVSAVETPEGKRIVKMVNLLPVSLTASVSGIGGTVESATLLTGHPDDTEARPVAATTASLDSVELPPYSLIVITVK